MKEVIYLDTYFFVNTLMNLVVLHLSGRLLRLKRKGFRLLLSSACGALYACAVLLLDLKGGKSAGLWFICLLLMGVIAFGLLPPRKMLSIATTSLFFSFLLGGLLEGMGQIIFNNKQKLGLSFVAFVGIFGSVFIRYVSERAREKLKEHNVVVTVKAFEEEYEWTGFCDSGNLLKEPTGGHPVILIGACACKEPALRPFFTGEFTTWEGVYSIPIQTACSSGLIFAFRPQEVTIRSESQSVKVENVVIGATSECKDFSGCECLVPSILL